MVVDSFDQLVREVLASSNSKTWSVAVGEWEVVDLEEDPTGEGVCVCGQTGLVKLFTISNHANGSRLYPIGSVCVNKFGRTDLDRQIDLFSGLHTLRKAIIAREAIALDSDYFTRAMLEHLWVDGAFTPDQWNGGNGENDYEFLLKMFNKRNKDLITTPQLRKIYMLMQHKVFPHVLADQRLR